MITDIFPDDEDSGVSPAFFSVDAFEAFFSVYAFDASAEEEVIVMANFEIMKVVAQCSISQRFRL